MNVSGRQWMAAVGLIFTFVPALRSWAQATAAPPEQRVAPAIQATVPALDVKAATDAYLAKVPPDKRARSDAYFEGGYWLILWNFLCTAVLMWLFLRWRWSARMRDLAEWITRFRPLQSALYWVQFIIAATVLYFPLTVYQDYFREHQYGLATQTFGPWLRDQFKGLLVGIVLGSILLVLLMGVVRRLQRTWWMWGAVVVVLFSAFTVLIAPVYIFPLFNKYTRLQDPRVTHPILSMARANGIPARDVWEVDASRQTTRISANVSGFLGTERITLNDNLLKRCSLAEIEAVMGHEMGHYVLNHNYKALLFTLVVVVVAFAWLGYGLDWALARWGQAWDVRGVGDTAVLPLAVLLLSIFSFVITPLDNTFTRTQEYEADIFGLNASRQPDGFAEVALKLGDYRKLNPTPLEEWIFYDHPSGRTRITAAMRWQAEHLSQPEDSGPASLAPPGK